MITKQEAILEAQQDWLACNDAAVDEASKYLGKKGNFNPPLEKPWPKWEELRKIADSKWYTLMGILREGLHEKDN